MGGALGLAGLLAYPEQQALSLIERERPYLSNASAHMYAHTIHAHHVRGWGKGDKSVCLICKLCVLRHF